MELDSTARSIVEVEWSARFGVDERSLRSGGVHVVVAELGANDAMSFRLGDTCILVVRPPQLDRARRLVQGLPVDEVFDAEFLHVLLGSRCTVDGPSWHGYVTEATFVPGPADGVVRLDHADARLLAFLRANARDDWAEAGFPLDPASEDRASTAFYGFFDDGEVVAAGNMTEWRGLPADVGVLTLPGVRGRGLAKRVARRMVEDALPVAGVVRYRALATNGPSLAVARAQGFGEYGQNYRARLAEREAGTSVR